MKKIFFIFSALAFQFLLSQKTRNVGDFTSVKVYDMMSVTLINSDKNIVEIVGDDNNDVEIVNKNGELKIRMVPAKLMQGQGVKVKVYYENLNDIQASQGSEITAEDTVENKTLNITSNEGSKINLKIDVDKLNIKVNSGGELNIFGNAESQNILVNSGGKFYGKEIDSKNAIINANAGGNAEVNATESVNATTRAGGVINIYGNPQDKKTQKVLGGTINFVDE